MIRSQPLFMYNTSLIKPISALNMSRNPFQTSIARIIVLTALIWLPISLGISAKISAEYSDSVAAPKKQVLSKRSFSLEDRYGNSYVNKVFKDNILLTLSYMSGQVHNASE